MLKETQWDYKWQIHRSDDRQHAKMNRNIGLLWIGIKPTRYFEGVWNDIFPNSQRENNIRFANEK